MGNYKKRFERDALNERSKEAIEGTSDRLKVDAQGIAGDNVQEPVPEYVNTPTEVIHSNKNNAWIVLGRDRNASRLSGYGGKGNTQCASVDIVVGRMGAGVKSVDENGEQLWTDPDFEKDAARIYISQKSDIDEYFKIDSISPSKTRSAIGMKADQIRVVAREKIKIVTGTDVKNSQGADIKEVSGVEIIAGNDESTIQSMVLGENLSIQQGEMIGLLDSLAGIVDSFLMSQFEFDRIVSDHHHISPYFAIPTTPSESLIPAGQKHSLEMLEKIKRSLLNFKINLGIHKTNYLEQISEKFICSRLNKVN
ncbi:MAG: hypothetical protein Q8P81_01485 [Nanoarchaeota archaeon]|nr:hypothetical protein [Nanoarchaeota archaeon]